MKDHLFVYGTLLPELLPGTVTNEVMSIIGSLCCVGPGIVNGTLYDLGQYPTVVLDASSEAKVFGKVFELPEKESLLKTLDRYEGFDVENLKEGLEKSLFIRKTTIAILSDGRSIVCWIYVYNREMENARPIKSGDYAQYKNNGKTN